MSEGDWKTRRKIRKKKKKENRRLRKIFSLNVLQRGNEGVRKIGLSLFDALYFFSKNRFKTG